MGRIRKVKSLDLEGNVVSYDSATKAALETPAGRREITATCKGRKRTAGRLLWAYSDDEFKHENLHFLKSYDSIYRERGKDIHNGKYTYQSETIVNSDTYVFITCNDCGNSFTQVAHSHFTGGGGCRHCSELKSRDTQIRPLEETLLKFHSIHGDKYDYSLITKAYGKKEKVKIICDVHGVFEQRVGDHASGAGCRMCTGGGFNPLKPAILYYLKVENKGTVAYKIGITNKTVPKRFGSDMQYITVLDTWEYKVGADAYNAEQAILKLNKELKYEGPPLLRSGNTELFSVNIKELYNV